MGGGTHLANAAGAFVGFLLLAMIVAEAGQWLRDAIEAHFAREADQVFGDIVAPPSACDDVQRMREAGL